MNRLNFLVALSLIVLLAGCGAVEDFKEMSKQQVLVQEAIQESLAMEAQIGWRYYGLL